MDFEGQSDDKKYAYESVRPNPYSYTEEWEYDEPENNEKYKEWAYKASMNKDTQHFADSFETINDIRETDIKPSDVDIPDPSSKGDEEERGRK